MMLSVVGVCYRQLLTYRYLLAVLLFFLCVLWLSTGDFSYSSSSSSSSEDIRLDRQQRRLQKKLQCPEGAKQQVILLTYSRSGSTLTADIIQKHPDVFYYFEPLHNLAKSFTQDQDVYQRETGRYLHLTSIPDYNNEATDIVEKLMTCRYGNLSYLATRNLHMKNSPSTNPMAHCLTGAKREEDEEKCLEEGEKRCLAKSIQFLKIIRMLVSSLEPLMLKYPCMKVIFLVRDPRAAFVSRKKVFGFMTGNTSYEAERLCVRMEKDIESAVRLHNKYPTRIHITRYETIAQRPLSTSRKLYEFLGLTFTEGIASYVYNQTSVGDSGKKVKDVDAYSVTRTDSAAVASAWREKISWEDVKAFDGQCRKVYFNMGYVAVWDEAHLRNLNVSLMFGKDYIVT